MNKRLLVTFTLSVAFTVGVGFAWREAYAGNGELLFNSMWVLVVLAPFAGILLAAASRRKRAAIEGGRVLRHDDPAILEHWTHAIGTAFLLATGIALGFLFIPSLLSDNVAAGAMMNVHFVSVVLFLFGTFYYFGNAVLEPRRFVEHLPTKNAIPFTVRHYSLLLGSKKYTMPPEAKYFESEKMAYVLALVSTVAIILSGFLKVAARVVVLPGSLLGAATLVHDVATVMMLFFFLAHVFFAAILPASWPLLRSMFSGYIGVEHVASEHAGWQAEITRHELAEAASASAEA